MARARTIKPSFFLNDSLGALQPLARLMFAGLWCIADREGRLEDRPMRIKIQVLPYDNCDPDAILNELHVAGFITRYYANDNQYIQVNNFTKHQKPHNNEVDSIIPPMAEGLATKVESTRALTLNPYTLTLNSDTPPFQEKAEKVPYQKIVDLWNAICGKELARVEKIGDTRKRHIRSRWNELKTLEVFEQLFGQVIESDFLTGKRSDWRATFDWLMKSESNVIKVQEGTYKNQTPQQQPKQKPKNPNEPEYKVYVPGRDDTLLNWTPD